MKERTVINQGLCDHVKILLAGGAGAKKAAEMLNIGSSTVHRIKQYNFDAEAYKAATEKRMAEAKHERTFAAGKTYSGEAAEMNSQMTMDILQQPAEVINKEQQTSQMRFQAAMMDKLITELDKINDTLNMLIRATRRE